VLSPAPGWATSAKKLKYVTVGKVLVQKQLWFCDRSTRESPFKTGSYSSTSAKDKLSFAFTIILARMFCFVKFGVKRQGLESTTEKKETRESSFPVDWEVKDDHACW
jgi:hypothetical protein